MLTLRRSILSPQIPTSISDEAGGAKILSHDLFTNDVLYLEAALDMRGVPAQLLPLLPLFCRSLTQMGTATESFVELTERIGRKVRPGCLSVWAFADRCVCVLHAFINLILVHFRRH